MLRYRDPARAVTWLRAAFGFNVHHVVKASNDDMMCAQLTLGNSMFIIGRVGDASFDALMKQPDEVGGAETQLTYIVVADIDDHYQRAKRSGAAIAVELGDYEEGGRGYSCRDLEGHVWSFGSFDPWKLGPPAVPAVRRSWSTRPLAALALTVALAGAASRLDAGGIARRSCDGFPCVGAVEPLAHIRTGERSRTADAIY